MQEQFHASKSFWKIYPLNYQIIAAENTAVCVEKSFMSMHSRMSRILYLKLNTWYLSLYA